MTSLSVTTASERSCPKDISVSADFLEQEIWRSGASLTELQTAITFVKEGLDPRAYEDLTPRMRRLVDLVTVAGHALAQKLCDSPQMSSAA